jgi:hypothetical protein
MRHQESNDSINSMVRDKNIPTLSNENPAPKYRNGDLFTFGLAFAVKQSSHSPQ